MFLYVINYGEAISSEKPFVEMSDDVQNDAIAVIDLDCNIQMVNDGSGEWKPIEVEE